MNEPVETIVVRTITGTTPERTPKLRTNSRQYKASPKHVMGGQEPESLTMDFPGSSMHNSTKNRTSSSNNNIHNMSNTSNSKVAEDPVNLHYRQNFGKDGIYVPPMTAAMRLSKITVTALINDDLYDRNNGEASNNNNYPRTGSTATSTSTTGTDDRDSEIIARHSYGEAAATVASSSLRVSTPYALPSSVPVVVADRGVENDVPFDQATDYDAARETVASFRDGYDEHHTRLRNSNSSSGGEGSSRRRTYSNNNTNTYDEMTHAVVTPISISNAPTSLRTPTAADLEGSCYSIASTGFESVWMSTPEVSPDRIVRITSRQTHDYHHQQIQCKDDVGGGAAIVETSPQDELDENFGRFTLPPPKLSGPNTIDDSLTRNLRLSTISSNTLSHNPTDRISIQLAEVEDQSNNIEKELAMHRIRTNKGIPRHGGSHSIPSGQDSSRKSNSALVDNRNANDDNTRSTFAQTSDSCNACVPKLYDHPGTACTAPQAAGVAPTANVRRSDMYNEVDSIIDSVLEVEDERVISLGGEEEPDNLYKNVRVTHKVRRRTRQRRKVQHLPVQEEQAKLDVDDDTSTENYGANPVYTTSLQERAHQAWKSRQQKKNSSFRSKLDGGAKSKGTNVSFGAPNTVHHFEPEPPLPRPDDEETLTSMDRSLNSEYTKTLESEVEDMIKDILLIGNSKMSRPGRRKIRDKPDIRRRIKQRHVPTATVGKGNLGTLHENQEDYGDEEESDLPPVYEPLWVANEDNRGRKWNKSDPSNDSLYSTESTRSRSQSLSIGDDRSIASSRASSVDANTVETFRSERDSSDPFIVVMGFVEGGISAMSTAMGFDMGDDESRTDDLRGRQQSRAGGNDGTSQLQSSLDGLNIFNACTGGQSGMSNKDNTPMSEMMGMLAQDLWFGPSLGASGSGSGQRRSVDTEGNSDDCILNLGENGANDKEEAKRLLQLGTSSEISCLAVHAAHSVHKLQGVEYDESVSIDMHKDLKMSSVQLKLPLGREFSSQSIALSFQYCESHETKNSYRSFFPFNLFFGLLVIFLENEGKQLRGRGLSLDSKSYVLEFLQLFFFFIPEKVAALSQKCRLMEVQHEAVVSKLGISWRRSMVSVARE
jgi:hypothetical protein